MKEIRKLVILGSGGFGAEALWVVEDMNRSGAHDFLWEILGFGDDNPDKKGGKIQGCEILGTSNELANKFDPEVYFHCSFGKNAGRARVAQMMKSKGFRGATLIHPSVVIEKSATVGEGTYIGANSVVAPGAQIGDFVLINTLAGIGHDCAIGDFVQVCPGAKVNGDCTIDRFAFIGSNASVQPGKTVGESATVGANSFVVRSVKPHSMVCGVPARVTLRPKARKS